MQSLFSWILACLLLVGGGPAPAPVPAESLAPRQQALTIDLGDGWSSQAVLTYPAKGEGPWPTLILFHGSGPYDMDATYALYPGAPPLSANFKHLAEEVGREGIAVLRFHKRGVKGYGEYDQAQVQKATTNQLIKDAGAVIAAARSLPQVDAKRLYLYGWSQGAQVASHAAAADPAIAGLILQGPPTSTWAETLRYQHLELALPLLKSQADQDGDGKLALLEWFGVPAGPASLLGSFYVWAEDSTPFAPKLRPSLDQNGDGLVDIDGELRPAIESYLAFVEANPFIMAATEPAESLAAVVPKLGRPVLILHGEQDGWVRVADGEQIAAAAPDQVSLKRFPGLGHALSPTAHPALDSFGVMDPAPIRALIDWLQTR